MHKKFTGAMLAQTRYRSSHRRCSVKNVFLSISHYSQKNTSLSTQQHRCFTVNIAKFLKTPILKNICERLLLLIAIFTQKNNHMERCFDLPEPKLHKKLSCVTLIPSPQTTFQRKIIFSGSIWAEAVAQRCF